MYSYIASYSYLQLCKFHCVTVDGGWSEWEHTSCTKTCGGGTMGMIRKCNNPKPSCGGINCVGSSSIQLGTLCNDFCCPGNMVLFVNEYEKTRLMC